MEARVFSDPVDGLSVGQKVKDESCRLFPYSDCHRKAEKSQTDKGSDPARLAVRERREAHDTCGIDHGQLIRELHGI